jgi:TonB family protein
MPHMNKLPVVLVLFGLSCACAAIAQTASPKSEPWLLQNIHIVGDIRDGFRKTCLIVYPNGEYHREKRRQVSRDGRAQFEWEAPEVFEAKLTEANLNALQAILENPEFSSTSGELGDSESLMHKLVFGPQGAVRPHENIEIFTVAVPRINAPQVFEMADVRVARRRESFRAFLDWINVTEQSEGQRLAASEATNCSPLTNTGNAPFGSVSMPVGMIPPKAISMPAPQPPHGARDWPPVAVNVLINPDGSLARLSIQSHLSPSIEQSVLDAVRKWKFQPARLLGVPVAATIHVTVEFRDK